ncbi:MAG: hypothetical protein IJ088_04765 [Clostridia bacterium]|nr:hypothetical protein [Clostridia bacterium]MBQ9008627.1 hypothetical protein [Clostridia bacterium]
MSRHLLSRKARRHVRKLLYHGYSLEVIPSYMNQIFPDFTEFRFLPKSMKKELYLLEAECYLKCHPNATRDERRLIRAWVRAGHNPWIVILKDDCNGSNKSMDFLEFERFLKEEDHVILPLYVTERVLYDDLPF